ncbi:ABC transporter ATP-binding protein [Brevundimonas diminuta]|uniref:ABC transporter ATP-binding protein n=1 Tax=Brevundimonas diminuta TaxID=293 RepID=UPI00320A2D84
MNTPLLSVQNLGVAYGSGQNRRFVLRGAEFDLAPGQVMAIVGESGSGKSTLVRAVAGLVSPSEGRITFKGEALPPLSKRSRAMLHSIQMVFQDPGASLNPRQSIHAILEEPLIVVGRLDRAARRRRVDELIDLVHLHRRLLDLRPSALSGGQKQRIAIARALSMEPRLLIADEALSALDFANQDKISTLLLELKERLNLAMLFVSHDMRSVRRMADQVCVIQNGQVLEQGPVAEVLYRPQTPYTQLLLAAALNPAAALSDPRLSAALESGGPVTGDALAGVMDIIGANARMQEQSGS